MRAIHVSLATLLATLLVVPVLVPACSSSSSDATTSTPDGGNLPDAGDMKDVGTTNDSGGQSDDPPANPFSSSITATRVVVEIDYQTGAEPYVGTSVAFGDTWQLFQTNSAKLFEGTGRTVEVPTTLDGMQRLEDVTGTTFDADAILAIAAVHQDTRTTSEAIAYYVVWLDGTYSEDGAEKKDVLGVTLGHTGVIAMFKPVIESSGIALVPDIERVVEQTVLVHEFGHAIGLVNNGIATTSQHQDTAHGAHCTNEKCVMYWSVEGVAAARDYAQKHVTSSDLVLFADDCLADVHAAAAE